MLCIAYKNYNQLLNKVYRKHYVEFCMSWHTHNPNLNILPIWKRNKKYQRNWFVGKRIVKEYISKTYGSVQVSLSARLNIFGICVI